jgi:uncharacterized protein YlxW (UPF0749 family)
VESKSSTQNASQIKLLRSQHLKLQESISELQEQKSELAKEIKQIELEEFKDFCLEVKCKNIKEYEDNVIFAHSNSNDRLLTTRAELEHQ